MCYNLIMSEHLPSPETYLTNAEHQELTSKVGLILDSINQVKQSLVRSMVGDETYQSAQDLWRSFEDESVEATPEAELALSIIDREQDIDRARAVLTEEPENETGYFDKIAMEYVIRRKYPDDTVLSILDQPDKLSDLGSWLRESEQSDKPYQHPEIEAVRVAEAAVDEKISQLYAETVGIRQKVSIYLEKDVFDFSLDISTPEIVGEVMTQPDKTTEQKIEEARKLTGSSNINLLTDELRLNGQPVVLRHQGRDVMAMLLPLIKIIDQFEAEV